jgi:hypothetical protein
LAGFHGRFVGARWPWWWGGLAVGWIGPVFWPYAYYDFFDYVFWPYSYDNFWPYAYDDVYYGIYGPYGYGGSVNSGEGRPTRAAGSESPRAPALCGNNVSNLTDWPIERISDTVQPTDAQRAMLDELRSANEKAINILKDGCPKDLPSTPTGRVAAMQARLEVMLHAVRAVRQPLEYASAAFGAGPFGTIRVGAWNGGAYTDDKTGA